MNHSKLSAFVIVFFLMAMPGIMPAQDIPVLPVPVAQSYEQPRLDQILAPIALYPDPLLGQILMASAYPQEVVAAEQWLQNPAAAGLQGDALAAALQPVPWDPSVKSLVAFPQVLSMMSSNIQWMQEVGQAFISEQPAVTDSIQRLRQQALASGALDTTPQQIVASQDGAITIMPAAPAEVYVPYYNPMYVYGAWPYPGYEPVYFPPPPGVYETSIITFGIGVAVIAPLWGWEHWDWRHHHIAINEDRFVHLGGNRTAIASGAWHYEPARRAASPSYQFHTIEVRPQAPMVQNYNASRPLETRPQVPVMRDSSLESYSGYRGYTTQPGSRTVEQHNAAPMFESFSRKSDVQAARERGLASRREAGAVTYNRGERGGESMRRQ